MIGSLPILDQRGGAIVPPLYFFLKGMILWLNLHHPGFKLSPLGRTSL